MQHYTQHVHASHAAHAQRRLRAHACSKMASSDELIGIFAYEPGKSPAKNLSSVCCEWRCETTRKHGTESSPSSFAADSSVESLQSGNGRICPPTRRSVEALLLRRQRLARAFA